MSNREVDNIYKDANLPFSVTPKILPYNRELIRFSSQDKGLARLVFEMRQGKNPYNLTGVTGEVTLVMANGSRFIEDATIIDPTSGTIEYILTDEQLRCVGKAKGELILKLPNQSSVAGFLFEFVIEASLKDKDLEPIEEYYFKDFIIIKEKLEGLESEVDDLTVIQVNGAKKDTQGVVHPSLDSRIVSEVGKLEEKQEVLQTSLDSKITSEVGKLEEKQGEITEQLAEKVSKVNGKTPDAEGNVTIDVPQVDMTKVATKEELISKRDKNEKIKSSDLDTTSDDTKIKEIHLSTEVKQMMAGDTPVNAEPPPGGVNATHLANKSAVSTKRTAIGENGFLYVASPTAKIEIDTYAKVMKFPVNTRFIWRNTSYNLKAEAFILDLSSAPVLSGIYVNTDTFVVSAKAMSGNSSTLENEVLVGFVVINAGASDSGVLNCNRYTINNKSSGYVGLNEIESDHLKEKSVTSVKQTPLARNGFLHSNFPIEIDTVTKTLKTTGVYTVAYGKQHQTFYSGQTFDISGGGVYCRICFDTVTNKIVGRPTSDANQLLETDVVLGFAIVNNSAVSDKAVLNSTMYTVNGRAGIPDNAVHTTQLKNLALQGKIMTNGSVDIDFTANKLTFKGSTAYLIYADKGYKIPDGMQVSFPTTQMGLLYFNPNTKAFGGVAIATSGDTVTQLYAVSQDFISIGVYDRVEKVAFLDTNNLTINGKSSTGGQEYLPSYITNELDTKTSTVITKPGDLHFAFNTDIHLSQYVDYTQKMKVIGECGKYGILDFICVGGDVIDGGQDKPTNLKRLANGVKYAKDSAPTEVLFLQGNHDTGFEAFSNNYNWEPSPETVITPKDWHNIALKHLEGKVEFDSDNHYGGYYYKDFPHAKIRIVGVNTSDCYVLDENGIPKHDPLNTHIMQKQIDWLQTKALNFMDKGADRSNWAVIVLSHASVNPAERGGTTGTILVENILDAYMRGTTYSGTSGDGDFRVSADCNYTEQGEMEFICNISGHLHYDRVVNFAKLNRPSISVDCSKTDINPNPTGLPEGVTRPTRTVGTVSEELFDFFSIDKENRKIHVTRFGAGNSRIISY